jgi:RNA polymerase sigma-70 factor (ECF subfamily)
VAEAPDARLHELLQRYGAFLRRTILKICPRDLGVSCEDIEQEAQLGLWSALQREREIQFPVSYIHKVAVSATLRTIRRVKARREEQLEEDPVTPTAAPAHILRAPPEASPDALAERQELRHQITAALGQLPENRRHAVRLHLQGLTTMEIGNLLGWSEPKARNLVYRGLQELRRSLRALGIGDKR